MTQAEKQKVAIIGGGLGAMASAFALTAPEQNGRYDVTVHTMGWRLGGKGASGRNPDINQRVEEHGLHIWFGCYDNSFTMMRQVFDELARPPEAPLSSVETAFRGLNHYVFKEHINDEWKTWKIDFPQNDYETGGHPELIEFIGIILDYVVEGVTALGHDLGHGLVDKIRGLLGDFSHKHRAHYSPFESLPSPFDLPRILFDFFDHLHHRFEPETRKSEAPELWEEALAEAVEFLAKTVWAHVHDRVHEDDEVRRHWILVNLGTTIARGILLDNLIENGVDHIDEIDGREWLYKHASLPHDTQGDPNGMSFDHGPIQALYDACFAYLDGDVSNPQFSAATLLRACLWLPFSYKGSFAFEMQAGMGDTVFTPFYQVLLQRGVKFNFFSQATDMTASEDGSRVESITIHKQVKLKGDHYYPLVKVKDLLCWPNAPLFDQIVSGAKLKSSGANLEHYSSGWKNAGPVVELKAGEDFDLVVFAVPLPAHQHVCPELIRHSAKWTDAVAHVRSTPTQAMQLWFGPTRQELGVELPPVITGTFVEPWSSLSDFSHLLLREDWSNEPVNYLTYTCGAMPVSVGDDQAVANEYVFASAKSWLEHNAKALWPRAYSSKGEAFDWATLHAPPKTAGADRLKAQYLRANIDANELYVLSTPGGIDHRPRTRAAGFDNLYFAGDWTNNGFNISSVEGAVMSGLQASRAISGYPQAIVGEDPRSLSPSWP